MDVIEKVIVASSRRYRVFSAGIFYALLKIVFGICGTLDATFDRNKI